MNETLPVLATTAEAIDARLMQLFPGAIAVPRLAAFAALRIKKSFGDQLLAQGILTKVKFGKLSQVTIESIKHVMIHGIPPRCERPPAVYRGRFPKRRRAVAAER
jgi:hypothetical protein